LCDDDDDDGGCGTGEEDEGDDDWRTTCDASGGNYSEINALLFQLHVEARARRTGDGGGNEGGESERAENEGERERVDERSKDT
jgi:hypothetical protein